MGATSRRLPWPDVAKGLSILGVIVLHVTLEVPGGMDTPLAVANAALDPIRMPLFFLISGFFAPKIFHFTFRELFLKRLWFLLVPYLIWVPIEQYLKGVERGLILGEPMPVFVTYVRNMAIGVNMAWFLYALVTFNIALWLTRRLPPLVAMAMSFTPILALSLHQEYHMVGKAILYLPLFFMGAHLKPVIATYTQRCLEPLFLTATVALYGLGLVAVMVWRHLIASGPIVIPWYGPGMETMGVPEIELLVRLSAHLLMIGAGLTGAVLLSKVPVVSPLLQAIGRHTLPLYLGHPIALTLLYHIPVFRFEILISPEAEAWTQATETWVAIGLGICLLGGAVFYAISRIPVLGWCLAPPSLIRREKNSGPHAAARTTIPAASNT
ncbi:acyltransferase family protein [Corynebacterium uterequi]|uniref:Putative membrane protein n=1 Tax=Corynebacterium uterequi TaxID=1072256 RepID=A0A0G3HDP0_9CORY|nr:acyltransferase family protein [Corynebacterium uterequi]AKK11486.1 putative membrane protein [Corynebacterium uterequi]